MAGTHHSDRHELAGNLLDQARGTGGGIDVVESLSAGLNNVRDLVLQRIQLDVERYFGMDSMSISLSPDQSEYNARAEIDIWQILEASRFAHSVGFVPDQQWAQAWLGQLRLGGSYTNGPVSQRLNEYLSLDPDEQKRHFARCLEKVFPEARRCPLVLYQLVPHAVGIVVAVAFGSTEEATAQRDRQKFLLPAIADCRTCHGSVLDNGETCAECGNPVWIYKWLLSDE